jgi:hypothetical protein
MQGGHDLVIKFFVAWFLVAATVTIHAAGLGVVLNRVMRPQALQNSGFRQVTWLIIRAAWWLILIHLAEIAVWGLFYWWRQCLPDAESAFYFAGVTYTTVGYGDLVLPREWRMLAPVEAMTGILMCGLSTGFFFALVNRLYRHKLTTDKC